MKKLLLAFMILSAANAFSQESSTLDGWVNKIRKEVKTANENTFDAKKSDNKTYSAGDFLEKSAKFQYAAIGSGVLSGVFVLAGVNADNWAAKGSTDKDRQDNIKSARTPCYVLAAASGVSSLICTFLSIDYKMKAGKALKVSTNGLSGAITYNF